MDWLKPGGAPKNRADDRLFGTLVVFALRLRVRFTDP
jgi:hypothetical protein